MDEGIQSSLDECEGRLSKRISLEERSIKADDYKSHTLAPEEHDEILREYNAGYSIQSESSDTTDRTAEHRRIIGSRTESPYYWRGCIT
ncbi:hypothetical protein EU527_06265 [Candidatus Thorarchaeota archaeon]|nr:MAG: hypothetical protein EU527_06265 [Candidatus Thorarchaeota archaeon]